MYDYNEVYEEELQNCLKKLKKFSQIKGFDFI